MDNYQFDPEQWKQERKTILKKCYSDTREFCKFFIPEAFDLPFYDMHDTIFNLIDHGKKRKKAICAGRGIGKTTITTAVAAKAILYRERHFILYVSKSETAAMMQTENLKSFLTESERIRAVFGKIKIGSSYETVWSKKGWVGLNYTYVMPRGAGQQIRSLKWGIWRPDLFIFDDLEDDDEIENEENRKTLKRWFFGSAIKAVPPGKKSWMMIYIDTLKHEDALLLHLLKSPNWEGVTLPTCDDDHKTLIPDFLTQEDLDAEITDHRDSGTMDVFARERMCKPISREDASFQYEMFKYYSEHDPDFIGKLSRGEIESVVILDPAKTKTFHSAESGIVVWGIDRLSNALYLREARGEHYHPDELFDDAFKTADHYNARIIGYEDTSLNEFISQPLQNEMIRRGKFYELVPLKARTGAGELSGYTGGKAGRVLGLLPYYRQGLIYHNTNNCGKYETQLLSFPRPAKWDVIDAAAYIIELISIGGRYFLPKSIMNEKEMPNLDDYIGQIEYDEPIRVVNRIGKRRWQSICQ